MTEELKRLTDGYASALKAYLEGQGEAALLRAYDLGRAALGGNLSVLEMSTVHQVALVRTLLERLPEAERRRLETMAGAFSAESLLPFEMSVQGTHEANAVLQQLTETLAGKNAEILRQLQELRALESLKDDLMSLIVHDLRNPLAGMLSCLDLLKPRPGDPEYEPTLEIVTLAREGARKLSELLEDLLEVRKLEEGQVKVQRELVVLPELLHEAVATLAPSARLEQITIEVTTRESGLVLEVDRRLMRRMIENLLSNALKFSRPGSTVTLAVRATSDRVFIEVKDRGPGVSAELRGRLFEKFSSVEAKGSGRHRGFGLGLYVVKLVATTHGGGVEVEPREGGGTVFRVALPRT